MLEFLVNDTPVCLKGVAMRDWLMERMVTRVNGHSDGEHDMGLGGGAYF